MVPTWTVPAAAALLIAMALQLSAAASFAAPPPATVPVGLPGCDTTCGNVSVPYPFGFGPSRCYWPGLNLTCDTTHHPPRLLLGDGTLRVSDIFIENGTVRVMRTGFIINATGDFTSSSWNASLGRGFTEYGYKLSYANEIIVFGCNVVGRILADNGENPPRIIGACTSFCTMTDDGSRYLTWLRGSNKYCIGTFGCCQASISFTSPPHGVQANWLSSNHTVEQKAMPVNVIVAEEGWLDRQNGEAMLLPDEFNEVPILLEWSVTQGLPQRHRSHDDILRMLCKSQHSYWSLVSPSKETGVACFCQDGYEGNPYLAGGCQVTDGCLVRELSRNPCFGECINFPGGYKCRCPRGSNGNPSEPGGCSQRGLIIGLSVATAPALLLLVLGIIFITRKIKQRRVKLLKQKYFKQNRGQLLQQLVSQKTDIAERMIIPVDELAKATNNFDKAREIGGGGHGTVYKGIISDLHVVAIKKSKITIKREIDEFINEVAILSQVNHKNVVKLFGCCLETEVPLLVYEFISNGALYDHLHVEGPWSLSWSNRLRIATEIATSLAYLHYAVSVPIIHRDIKSHNILLDDALTSKISDFGASRYIAADRTWFTSTIQGTRGYMDPLCMSDGRLTEKSDVYSFGVILMELLTRKKPFLYLSPNGDGLATHFVKLLAEGNLVHIIDPQVLEEGDEEVQGAAVLAASCVKIRDEEERPTMRQVEHTLEGFWSTKKKKDGTLTEDFRNQAQVQRKNEESSRIYSLEQEMVISASYPR